MSKVEEVAAACRQAVERAGKLERSVSFEEMSFFVARAAIEAIPLEQLIRDAYVRGVEWNEENPLDRDYRFKAAADYADKTLSAALNEEG